MPKKWERPSWLAANDVVEAYANFGGGRKQVRAQLAEALLDGDLRSQARLVARVKGKSVKKAWATQRRTKLPDRSEPMVSLEKSFWRQSEGWQRDQDEWRWKGNRFSVTTSLKPFRRDLIRGLEFDFADARRVLGHEKDIAKRPGAVLDTDRWRDFCRVIAACHAAGEIVDCNNPTWLADQIHYRMIYPFGDDKIEAEVAWLLDRVKNHGWPTHPKTY